jgi:VWFA-related protein
MPLLAALVLLLQAVISVHTELVAVPVVVTDGRGQHVGGLTQNDFQVYDDGQPQPIAVFHHGDAAVTLGLVVDRSRSMRAKNAAVLTAIAALLKDSRPDDELFGVGFGDSVAFALAAARPFTSSAGEMTAALAAMPADGRTALYDGVAAALEHLETGHAGKKVLIVVSDGGDNASVKTYAEVLALAGRSDAVIYAIGILSPSPEDDEDAGLIKRLCRDTGGVAYFPRTAAAIVDTAGRVARDIREQYTIGFVPGTSASGRAFHKVDVKVSAPGHGRIHVRTRGGYVVQP